MTPPAPVPCAPAPRGLVILDLDGTLVDSAPDLAAALDATVAGLGLAPFGVEGTRALIGHGVPALLRGALAARGVPAEGPEAEAALARLLALYAAGLSVRTRPYPGIPEALDALRGAGWRLAVCTNKPAGLARRLLDDLGLGARLDAVAGPDTAGVAKPDPRALAGLARAGERAVVVGDSAVDVATARAAGLPVVAVAWGYPGAAGAGGLGADALAGRAADLPALVEAVARGA